MQRYWQNKFGRQWIPNKWDFIASVFPGKSEHPYQTNHSLPLPDRRQVFRFFPVGLRNNEAAGLGHVENSPVGDNRS